MDLCFSAGVMGWHELMGLKDTTWISESFLRFAERSIIIYVFSIQNSLIVRPSNTMILLSS